MNTAPEGTAPPAVVRRGLTSRERQIVALLASGASRKEIAASLGIGVGTVGAHVRGACIALGLRGGSRALAALFAATQND